MAANDVPCCETMFWVYLVISTGLVSFAGLMSGLTLGLMSLSLVDLEVLMKAGQPNDQKNAAKILPIVKNQHLLLCTLLICNSLAMEALPIFLDALLPAWGAILISVTLILAFGEIIPQAVCSRYGLSIGAKLSPLVRLLVIVFLPLSYPISKLLDLLLGKGHSALLRRAELKTLVDLHGNEAGKGGELTHDETTIISGALDLTQKTAKDAMTPLSRVFSLNLNSKIDDDLMDLLIRKGHSRVPVHSGTEGNVVGLILVKNLIKYRPENEALIKNLTIRRIPRVLETIPLYDLLNQFQKGHSHMAVVVKNKDSTGDVKAKVEMLRTKMNSYSPERQTFQKEAEEAFPNEEVIGIITMEDVLEQLLQEPIFDETDGYVEVHNKIKINMLPGMKFFSRSPRAGSPSSKSNWRSPMASPSPLSSAHQTPISYHQTHLLHSPVSAYTSPCAMARPNPYPSPGNLEVNSPYRYSRSVHSSPVPLAHADKISRQCFSWLQKLRLP